MGESPRTKSPPPFQTCHFGMGANLGSRAKNLREALRRVAAFRLTRVWAVSSFHETAPVGVTDQPRFLNAAVAISTALAPRALLAKLLRIEAEMGRVRTAKWGPRLIDLDILLYGEEVIDGGGLTVPHPEMHLRRFVLDPLSEIAPLAFHPVLGKTVAQLRLDLAADGALRPD